MSTNPDSVTNQGQFHSGVPPAEPRTRSGHQLGQQVGNEAAPKFRAKTFAPGTAPEKDFTTPHPGRLSTRTSTLPRGLVRLTHSQDPRVSPSTTRPSTASLKQHRGLLLRV